MFLAGDADEIHESATISTKTAGFFLGYSNVLPMTLRIVVCMGFSLRADELTDTPVAILDVFGPSGRTAGFWDASAGRPESSVELLVPPRADTVPDLGVPIPIPFTIVERAPIVVSEAGEHTLRLRNVENPLEQTFWVHHERSS